MQLSTSLSTAAPTHREAAVRPRAAAGRPGLAARGAALARMLLVPGAAEELLREIGDVPPAAARD